MDNFPGGKNRKKKCFTRHCSKKLRKLLIGKSENFPGRSLTGVSINGILRSQDSYILEDTKNKNALFHQKTVNLKIRVTGLKRITLKSENANLSESRDSLNEQNRSLRARIIEHSLPEDRSSDNMPFRSRDSHVQTQHSCCWNRDQYRLTYMA